MGARRRSLAAILVFLLACGLFVAVAGPATAACDAGANPVQCENALPGNPASEWDNIGGGAGDTSIQGFATDISVNKGQSIGFKVNTTATNWRIDFYRLGYYGGSGARKQGTVSVAQAQRQPACMTDSATGLVDCGNWAQSASWTVPATSTSGIYIARLVRTDTGGASHMIFVVRDDASTAKVLFQASDTTWQAYNEYGGNSLYVGNPAGRAYKVSYNRPFTTRATGPEDWVFNAEYPMIRWLESNGYDVSYTTDTDSDRRGALIKQHQTFLSVGHDEYWSGNQRTNVESARAAGVNLAFFSGNEVFWKTRFENSIAGPATANRTLVSYKETHANAKIDPTPAWTGTWRDPRFSPPADGGRPENALTGQLFVVNDGATTAIQVPAAEGKMRLWRNTTVATLAAGKVATFPNGTLGYEWDVDRDNGVRPAGLVHLSSTTASVPSLLLDNGSSYGTGTATHTLTLYRAASGALVFGAGTVQWSWGLDANHDRGNAPADVRMQQATVNLLADMGAQPGTLRPGLVAATASTDTTGPAVAIIAPAAGATVTAGSTVAITGTATDVGGQVGAVEVSTDGTSWHPATGRAAWSYSWTPNSSGPVTIMVRAADDSANLGATASRTLNSGGGGPQVCPCTIWPSSAVPTVVTDSDTSAVELGVKFRASVNGTVTGVRFYKGPSNTGTHVGRLWSSTGTQLATVNFTGETASGWQQATFATPVAVTAGVTYVVSYVAPVGRYSADSGYFTGQGVSNPPVSALGSGVDGLDGVYHYGAGFPTDSYQDTNYWVDVAFSTTTTTTTSTTTTTTSSTTTTTTSPTTTTTTMPTTTTTTTAPPPACPCSIWRNNPTPGTPSDSDTGAVELGLKFKATRNGTVSGVRFYKGTGNTGTHVGNLWSSTGVNLGRVTFTNETASGWQTATFATPVAVTANTTYVVSYFAPVGRYAGDANFFATTGVSSPPLQALAAGVDGANGVYRYGTGSAFPSSTYQSTNYWVDVIFN